MTEAMDNIKSKVEMIARNIFNNQQIVLDMNATAKDVDGWDSMTNLLFIDAIETEFKIKFSLDEILDFKNIGELCQNISGKI